MKPAPFEYLAPDSLDAALAAMAEHGDDAKVLAGGQSLVPAMNFRLIQPTMLVDLNGLGDLEYIRRNEDGELRIGAMTRLSRLERDSLVAEGAPLLHETIPYIAHAQIRNRSTLGGSLAHADPAAELPVVALTLEARMRAQSISGERWISADDFLAGMFTTDLKPEEILVEVAVPPMPSSSGWAFEELARRQGDYAMMGVAALVSLDDEGLCSRAKLVYLNAGDGPVSAPQAAEVLQGEKAGKEVIEACAVTAAEQEIDPFGNLHASVAYQRHLARVLTERALEKAFARALA